GLVLSRWRSVTIDDEKAFSREKKGGKD
ncbi:hypothetical protein CEXT_240271, partial [Caerostris extrusa]